MQAITWSPQLSNAVKELMKFDMYTIGNLFSTQKWSQPLKLSHDEVQAINSIISRKQESASTLTKWV